MRLRPFAPLVLLLVWLVSPFAQAAPPASDDWLGPDKAKHFGATLGLAGVGYGTGALLFDAPRARLLTGAGLALGVGLGKELYDVGRGGRFSGKDLAWDAVGTATGLALSWLIEQLLFREDAPRPPARPSAGSSGALLGCLERGWG